MNNSEVIRLHFKEKYPDRDYDLYLKWEYEGYCRLHDKNSKLYKIPKMMTFDEYVANHETWIMQVLSIHK